MAKKWRCTVCGYIHEGPEAPDQCPMCKVGKEKFVEVEEKAGGLDFVTEHKLGDGKGASQELWEGLNNHFMGECSEVGQYLAMARQADREGYPEIAEAFKRYAWEEAEHASKFAELIGDIVWDTKTNLFKRMNAECGACEDKMRLARLAKEQNLDAVHDTVHEMVYIDKTLKRMIARSADSQEMLEYAKKTQGMRSLMDSAIDLVKEGVTTPEEVMKIAYYSD